MLYGELLYGMWGCSREKFVTLNSRLGLGGIPGICS